MKPTSRLLFAEFLGTALLLFVIVGSGIAVEQLSNDGATRLLTHALAVGAGLAALIALFASVSGAHFNPAVTLGFWLTRSITIGLAAGYFAVQLAGAVAGVMLANATFDEGAITLSDTARDGLGRPVAELIATLVLVLLILGLVRTGRTAAVAPAVGAWIIAVIIATVSTGFANPAVTVARTLTDTYSGIDPGSVPAFLIAQFAGAALAAAVVFLLFPSDIEPAAATPAPANSMVE